MKLAVIGAGISGIYSAYELARSHDVTLYEANARLGGHTDTQHVATNGGACSVDTGFIVFNQQNYPLFSRFIDELGVASQPSNMSFSVSDKNSGLEYNATSIGGLVCERRNLVRPGFYRMLSDILKFYRNSPSLLHSGDDDMTIGEFLDANGYGSDFIHNHIIPMASALWSSPPSAVSRFPARYFVAFMNNHSLLQVANRPPWRTITGGSSTYVRSFERQYSGRVRVNSPVIEVKKSLNGVLVTTADDDAVFDAVVLACHSDQARAMLDERMVEQRSILGAIPYQSNEVTLHTDASVMPRNQKAWASWNVVRFADRREHCVVTYYMNLLQSIDESTPLLVSLNADCRIDRNKILLRRHYDHPVYTPESLRAQREMANINGRDRIYFAGAYLGWGFHEDGVRSARRAIDAIERLRVPDAA